MRSTKNKKTAFSLPLLCLFISSFLFLNLPNASAQTDPFVLSPKWYFGNKAGLDFTSGSAVLLSNGMVNGGGQEGSASICDPSKNLVFYNDGYRLYDSNHAFIQNLNGGTSSTQSSVIVPDPADPVNRFYLFTANVDDNGAGDKPASLSNLGIHYYHVQKNSGSVLVLAGPVKIADHAEVSEQLCSGSDGNGNYWVVAHEGGHFHWAMNSLWAWPVTASGVGTKVISSVSGNTGNNPWQGALKINKCQTRLAAVFSTGVAEIYDWDQATGKVTGMIRRVTGLPALYGCEFSPDGSILYYTSLGGNMLYQLDIASGAIYSDPSWNSANNSPEMGTMQLGPDNKIYVINASNFAVPCYLGVVNNPNVSGAGCNYAKNGFTLNSGPAAYPNVQRGISNISWLSPQGALRIVDNNCPTYSFDYTFTNYFNENISVLANSEEWDFGDGGGFQSGLGAAPSHTYASSGSYNVRVRLRDQTCNKQWTYTKQVNPGCVALPVDWLFVKAEAQINSIKISWATIYENNNDHFSIERSADGIHYTPIGEVNSKKNISGNIAEYSFDDFDPLAGNSYYRIRQIDLDGLSTISNVAPVSNDLIAVSIVPNPSADHFTLLLKGETEATVTLYDVVGKEIISTEIHSFFCFGEELSEGTYLVKITVKGKTFCKKIIKGN